MQTLCYERTIRNSKFDSPPVFIVGHWRSGTTLLHELMSLDPRMAFPNNYEVFVSASFPCIQGGSTATHSAFAATDATDGQDADASRIATRR